MMTIAERCMISSLKRACGLHRAAEDWLADPARIDVVEVEVQLRDHADIRPALPVDWNEGLNADLESVSDPEKAGIDGPRGHGSRRERIRHRRLQCCFNERDEPVDEIRQAEVNHGGL